MARYLVVYTRSRVWTAFAPDFPTIRVRGASRREARSLLRRRLIRLLTTLEPYGLGTPEPIVLPGWVRARYGSRAGRKRRFPVLFFRRLSGWQAVAPDFSWLRAHGPTRSATRRRMGGEIAASLRGIDRDFDGFESEKVTSRVRFGTVSAHPRW